MEISREAANTIVDPFAYAQWDPAHEVFKELRRSAPLAKARPDGYEEFWVVTRHEDVQFVEKNLNNLFRCSDRSSIILQSDAEEHIRQMTGGSANLVRSLVSIDNPDHYKLRHLTQSWFMPQKLRALEERIRGIARSFVDKMLQYDGTCDFARDIAFYYPLHVVMDVIGVPAADEPRMLKLTQEILVQPTLNSSG